MNIVAYGSLMSLPSLEVTLHRPARLTKITLPGWRRVFNAPFGAYAFLNIERIPKSKIEAAFFTIEPYEADLFTEREKGSEMIEVAKGFFAFVWPRRQCKELPALRSYVSFCEEGARNMDVDFWKGTRRPGRIEEDSERPLYP